MEIYCLSSGGWESKIRVSTRWDPSMAARETPFYASLLASGGLQAIFGGSWLVDTHPDPCLLVHMVFSLSPCLELPFL